MKVALLLTGLAREVQGGYERFWKHIIDNYDTDLYLHCWKDAEWEKVGEVYPEHELLIEQVPFKFTKDKEGIRLTGDLTLPKMEEYDIQGNHRQLAMFYTWEYTFQHFKNMGKKYDCVIRSRYDMWTDTPFRLENFDLSKIIISNPPWKGTGIHDDNICITNQEMAQTLFGDIYKTVLKIGKRDGELPFPEKTFTNVITEKGLQSCVHRTDDITFGLLRKHNI